LARALRERAGLSGDAADAAGAALAELGAEEAADVAALDEADFAGLASKLRPVPARRLADFRKASERAEPDVLSLPLVHPPLSFSPDTTAMPP